MIRILLVDDHPVVIEGLQQMMQTVPDIEVAGTALSARAAKTWFKENKAEIVILDISLPDQDGMDLCRELLSLYPELGIIGLTTYEEVSFVSRMLRNGAKGYLFKNAPEEEVLEAIRTVAAGETFLGRKVSERLLAKAMNQPESKGFIPRLTRREQEVLELIVTELTTQEIAEKLSITVSTVETHRKHLIAKLGARNVVGMVKNAIKFGLV
jgi:DNA-binding NarL/FixJ family response regulator